MTDAGPGRVPVERGLQFADQYEEAGAPPVAGAPAPAPNPLRDHFERHTEGQGLWKWRHYFDAYQRHLGKFVGREVNVLEIGVYSGGSLQMWKEYFGPRCRIFGVDINELCTEHEGPRVSVLIGDQGSREFWRSTRAVLPPIDVVIDDGSHIAEHQIVTLEEMLPHLRRGGVYLCEDIFGAENEFHKYLAGLTSRLNFMGRPRASHLLHDGMIPGNLQSAILSAHHYPFLCVIEKQDAAAPDFAAPQQGSHWTWDFLKPR